MNVVHHVRHILFGTVLGTMLFAVGSAAWADESFSPRSGFSLGPRFAVHDPKDGQTREFGGAQARLHLGPVLAIEASADARRDRFEGNTKMWTVPVQLSALVYLIPSGPISPFLLAGPGWYYSRIEGPNDFKNTQHRFGVHAGGGLQWWLSRGISVDGTYRYLWTEKLESRDVAFQNKKYDDSGHMFTVGVNFHF